MVYTIRIRDNSKKARSIINMLRAFEEDYDFIEISEELDGEREDEILKELEIRYQAYLSDHTGKEWDVLLGEL